jgi:cystathionine gamma-synthase
MELVGKRLGKCEIATLDVAFQQGDLVWLESPQNPTGNVQDLCEMVKRAHAVGATVIVDGTFAPAPLQYAFRYGVDAVMYSTTKFHGGHSDLLGGALIVRQNERARQV